MTLGVWILEKIKLTIDELCERIEGKVKSFNSEYHNTYNATFKHDANTATLTFYINSVTYLSTKLSATQLKAHSIDTTKYIVVEIHMNQLPLIYTLPLNTSNTQIRVFQSGSILKGEHNVNNKSFIILSQMITNHVATTIYNKYFPDIITRVCVILCWDIECC
jgi:hypothetical protein